MIYKPEGTVFSGTTAKEVRMDRMQQSSYSTILGRNPEERRGGRPIIVSHVLPHLGEYEFKWVVAPTLGKQYGHYGFKVHAKANAVNVQVYGEQTLIEYFAKTGRPVTCELELVVKRTALEREYILVNLYLTKPSFRATHVLQIKGMSPEPEKRESFEYTTRDMKGVGVSLKTI
jgi:hypothetical protein